MKKLPIGIQTFDLWLNEYNEARTHTGKCCYGQTQMQTFRDSLHLAKEKMLDCTLQTAS